MLNHMLDANAVTVPATMLPNAMAADTTFAENDFNANVTLDNLKVKKTIFSWIKTPTATKTTTNVSNASEIKIENIKTETKTKTKSETNNDSNLIESSAKQTTTKDAATETETETNYTCETLEASVKRTSLSRAKSQVADFTVGTLREFRGVQSLRHLWNKRINASAELKTAAHNKNNNNHPKPGSKLNKSVSCLVDASTQQQLTADKTELLRRRAQTKRTHSLHDLEVSSLIIRAATETEQLGIEIDSFHREKDNFYKYKTAEQAARHLARESKARSKLRRFSAGIVGSSLDDDAHFPAVNASDKGERIHWAKRQDIIINKRFEVYTGKTTMHMISPADSLDKMLITGMKNNNNNASRFNRASTTLTTAVDIQSLSANAEHLINCNSNEADKQSDSETPHTMGNAANDNVANSPQNASCKRTSEREATLAKRDSTDSASTTSTLSPGRAVRRTGSSASRKYSFKTHTHTRTYHLPRKMNANKDGHTGAGGFSMVAKLTQQFNEIIQKDKKLLVEVRRKNGVLMARNGHVYKVLPKIGERCKSNSNSPTASSPSISRSSSHAKDFTSTSMVQRNIKKFEKSVTELSEKPQVPVKSAQVLQKCTEIVSNKINKEQHVAVNRNKRTQLNLPSALISLEQTTKKPQQALEVVAEEAKTPLECDEKALPSTNETAANVAKQEVAEHAADLKEPTKECSAEENALEKEHHTTTIDTTIGDDAVNELGDVLRAATADEIDVASGDKVKLRKHRYAMIYEKFRFRSPFKTAVSNSKKESQANATAECQHKEEQTTQQQTVPIAVAATATDVLHAAVTANPEARILDALEAVDQKLKILSLDTDEAIILRNNDEFEQKIIPNSSFIYQATGKHTNNNNKPLLVNQAVNVALVNAIEGEQMIMEQKELQETKDQKPTDTTFDEPIYEPIAPPKEIAIPQPILQQQEIQCKFEVPEPQLSFLHCFASKSIENASDAIAITTAATALAATAAATNAITTTPNEDIYQTLEEVKVVKASTAKQDDYESIAGSNEQVTPFSKYDGYELFAPSTAEPTTPTTPVVRNTTDELPELPKPKRRLPKSPMPGKRPPRPKAKHNTATLHIEEIIAPTEQNDDHHYYADDDENIYDTIKGSDCYESLPSAQTTAPKLEKITTTDNISLASNCYESIANYRRIVTSGASVISASSHAAGSSGGSTLTISSDHKTNSLYEDSLAAVSLGYGARRRSTGSGIVHIGTNIHVHSDGQRCCASDTVSSHYRHSIATSSDNSDEWIDISDAELDLDRIPEPTATKQKFIVVRERFKTHRSPDWSKRVRDKRLNQKKAISCVEDDSDHYYESLSPLGHKRHSMREIQRTQSHHKRNQDLPRYAPATPTTTAAPATNTTLTLPPRAPTTKLGARASQRSKKHSASAHALGSTNISDDYDSFDTDTDEIYETEESMRNHNDSGVDICHVKQLPEPPSSTNQVYAIVKKFKNFISNKKSTTSKHAGSQQKLYENTAQFYVEGNVYENTPKAKVKHTKSLKKPYKSPPNGSKINNPNDDTYENTDFHSPPTLSASSDAKPLSTSEKNLSTHASNNELPQTATLRSKSKTGKSLRSRLRKSLVGSTFDSKTLSSLASPRSTFYIEGPTQCDSGELDSGFSEKASSGDLPTTAAIITPPANEDVQNFCTVRKPKKDTKSNNTQRRRTSTGIRPHEPPPPPPPTSGDAYKSKQAAGATTSWYAECGVFKSSTTNIGLDENSLNGSKSTNSQNGSMANGGTSWYAEAGLYQTSGVSVASSSGSSGVSTGNEAGLNDDFPHSMFLNEPLYQIYSAAKLESISRDMEDHDGSTDGYEEIGQNGEIKTDQCNEKSQKRARPTALQLIEPKNGPSRTLWSEISEVINSGILPTLTPRERALQEAKFEIITSEASYLKSLNLLRSHFMNSPCFRDTNILNSRDRKALFSYIVPVHECSERLLTELESCWQDNIMLLGLSKRIFDIAEKHFHVYIAFCEHQGRMDRTLRRLKESKGIFSTNLELIESSPSCCGLNLHSFLMLPMQRITRLPLLIDAVFSKVTANDDEYDNWKFTLAIMNKIVTQCNEAANRCEQAYEIERISRQLEFPTTVRALAIAPAGVSAPGAKPRFLVKKGELTHLIWRGDDAKLTFGKKFTKSLIYAFLFSDLLVLTKRKAEEQFQVFDYCPRNMLTISSGDLLPQLPTKDMGSSGKHLILMTLLENHERKTVELVLSCPSISEQERWLQAMRPPEAETPGEKLYEPWDCPQVIVKHAYESTEPDVMNLEMGDVINVTRKLPDGWYQGERIRDGAVGWFPGSYTEEVNSAHVRARNLKQRYRLLTFTATYLESQKRK